MRISDAVRSGNHGSIGNQFRQNQAGNSGEFYVTITRLDDAKNYKLRFGVAGTDPGTWPSQDVTRVRPATLISGLTPGITYTFQVSALGHMGWTDWSDPASKMVI